MKPKEVFQNPRNFRYTVLFVIIGLIVVSGILVAQFVSLNKFDAAPNHSNNIKELIITEMVLAGLATSDQATVKNPNLRQSPSYATGQPLALRVTTAPNVTRDIELSARLLTETGEIKDLDPSSIKLAAGTSTFCCWTIDTPGTYRLQIFRPEKTITSIPVVITAGSFIDNPLRLE